MKRFAVLLSTVFLVLGSTDRASATYIDELLFDGASEPLMYSPYDTEEGLWGGDELAWIHSYSGGSGILSATLTIVADDVDIGELVEVYVDGGTQGLVKLGDLTMETETWWDEIDHDNLGNSPLTTLSTTSWDINGDLLQGSELPIVVKTSKGFGVQIESSTLDVSPVPEPATMILLGSGLLGIVPFRRKFGKK